MLETNLRSAHPLPAPARAEGPAIAAPSTAAHALLDTLLARGVDTIFGIPGGAIGAVYDACADRPGLRVITNPHESASVFAAMAYARASGRPAAVLVTSGPGFTNALTGMAAASCEELPVLIVSGEVPTRNAGRFALQDGSSSGLDVLAIARPVTRFAARIERAEGVEGVVHRALSEATGARPGPALLALPLDVSRAPGRASTLRFAPTAQAPVEPPAEACATAAALLSSANAPLVVLGAGARAASASALAVELAERTVAMVTATGHAKGAFPERHRNYLGVLGFGGHGEVRASLPREDVALVVGSRLGDIATNGWTPDLAPSRALIHVDRDPSALGRNYDVAVPIVADATAALRGIVRRLPNDGARPAPAAPALDLDRDPRRAARSTPPKPQWLLATLERELPRDTIFTVDIGEHAAFALHHLRVDRAEQLHVFAGLGSMGSGLCGAIGVKVARPSSPVVAIVGDGSFAMHAGEILTCVDQGIPVVFVVLNDGRYGMVDAGNAHIYGRRCPGLPGTTADLAGVAASFGAVSLTVRRADDLAPGKLAALVALRRPVVIDVRIDPSEKLSVATRVASLAHFSSGAPA